MNHDAPDPAGPAEHELSAVLDRFEEAWHEGTVPNLETFLPTAVLAGSRQELLGELVKLDLEFRWRQKQSSRPDETLIQPGQQQQETLVYDTAAAANAWLLEKYVEEYPQLGSVDQLPLALIVEEYRVRQRWGDQPSHQDYLERFSQRNEDLSAALSGVDQELAAEREGTGSGQGQTSAETATVASGQDRKRKTGTVAEIGSVVGDYELLEEIGRGGMGVVYRARQLSLQREVALKMILPGQLADQEAVERFYSEAQIVGQLRHPNIVMVYEVAEHDGNHYFSMDYIEGDSLAERIRQAPLSSRESASFVAEVTRAIQFAHEAGILHRDLKPSNILIDGQGKPLVTDFGLAKRTEEDAGITRTGNIVGTPSYMPPEQVVAGSQDSQGPAGDVYSLGAILYELLTGRPPFRSDSMLETLMQVLEREPVAPRLLAPGTDRDLETITLKCLEKDPQRRYGSAAELADEIGRYLKGEPILARPVSSLERAWRWCKRKPAVAALSSVVMVALVAGTLISSYFAVNAAREAAIASKAKEVAETLRDEAHLAAKQAQEARLSEAQQREKAENETLRAQGNEALARRQAYFSDMAIMSEHWDNGNILAMRTLLVRHEDEKDLVNFEWHYWRQQILQAWRSFDHDDDRVWTAVFNPDKSRIVTGSDRGLIRIWDIASGNRVRTHSGHKGAISQLTYSPDGSILAASSADKTISLWQNTGDAKIIRLLTGGHHEAILGIDFSPNGKFIASAGRDKKICIWDVSSGKVLRTLSGHTDGVTGIAYSPSGELLVSVSKDFTSRIWNSRSGELLKTLSGGGSAVYSLAIANSGKTLATGHLDGKIYLWNLQTLDLQAKYHNQISIVRGLAFDPTDSHLAIAYGNNVVEMMDVSKRKASRSFKGHSASLRSCQFSSDGRTILTASSDGTAKIWDLQRPTAPYIIVDESSLVSSLSFSPDSTHLVTAGSDGKCSLKILETGKVSKRLPDQGVEIRSCDFDRRGQFIAFARQDRKIKIFDNTLDEYSATIEVDSIPTVVAYSPTNQQLAAGCESGVVILWSQELAEQHRILIGENGIRDIAYDQLGRYLAAGDSSGKIKIIDTTNGKVVQSLPSTNRSFTEVAFDGSGNRLVYADLDHGINVWDLQQNKKLLRMLGHTTFITGIALSPDSSRIASCSFGGRVKVWDIETGAELMSFTPKRNLHDIRFSPDGKWLGSCGGASAIILWPTKRIQ